MKREGKGKERGEWERLFFFPFSTACVHGEPEKKIMQGEVGREGI